MRHLRRYVKDIDRLNIGIYIISAVSNYSQIAGGILLSVIFLAGFLIIILNDELRNIKLEN